MYTAALTEHWGHYDIDTLHLIEFQRRNQLGVRTYTTFILPTTFKRDVTEIVHT